MRLRRGGIVLAVLLLGGTLPAQKPAKKQPKEGKSEVLASLPDDRSIDVAISEMLAAWQLGNVEMLHKYYGENVTVVSGAWETPVIGWANFLRAYQSQRQRMQSAQLERSNSYISIRGNVAWAGYQWEFRAEVDGKATVARGHTTLVLEKRKDHWVIVHNHTSIVPEVGSAPPTGAPNPPQPTKPGGPTG